MTTYERTCSECGKSLAGKGPTAKTCNAGCRKRRSLRLKRQRSEAQSGHGLTEHQLAVAATVRNEAPDIAHSVIQEELRPIVREALTADVLSAIKSMVGLTPRVIELLALDLESEDPVVRQRAYGLIARYTLGQKDLVSDTGDDSRQITVNFALPRPGDGGDATNPAAEGDSEETRQCDMCQQDKTLDEFVSGSSRCVQCFESQRASATALLNP